jgi:hypothetical protein
MACKRKEVIQKLWTAKWGSKVKLTGTSQKLNHKVHCVCTNMALSLQKSMNCKFAAYRRCGSTPAKRTLALAARQVGRFA